MFARLFQKSAQAAAKRAPTLLNLMAARSMSVASKRPLSGKKKWIQDLKDAAWVTLGVGGITLAACLAMRDKKELVSAPSVLKGRHDGGEDLHVVDVGELSVCQGRVVAGRSGAKVVMKRGDDASYYFKKLGYRELLLNELVVGELARLLFGGDAPAVAAVEIAIDNLAGDCEFGFISRSVNGARMNLQDWAHCYSDRPKEVVAPGHLGVALAYNILLGNADCKLANLMMHIDSEKDCYSIDHELMFRRNPVFLTNAVEGVNEIGDFQDLTPGEMMLQQGGDMCVSGLQFIDVNQPIRNDRNIKAVIRPILVKSIEADIVSGKVMAFYKKFSDIPEESVIRIFEKYGNLFQEKERKKYVAQILERQRLARVFVAENTNQDTVSLRRGGLNV